MSLKQLLTTIDSEELTEWFAFYAVEQEQAKAAEIDEQLMNVFGDPKDRKR